MFKPNRIVGGLSSTFNHHCEKSTKTEVLLFVRGSYVACLDLRTVWTPNWSSFFLFLEQILGEERKLHHITTSQPQTSRYQQPHPSTNLVLVLTSGDRNKQTALPIRFRTQSECELVQQSVFHVQPKKKVSFEHFFSFSCLL